ncbi:DUF2161 family putative PD-(D/E)XK-type phosphodiesterase [Paenibacillus pasadenensis]|uniref:DUF2161 family putative PD-(D/E)XK-type phosphodiesterase n=1 Tax=Paenibacillus pasadenensis TaxID=217090 RepID=UPI00203C8F0F|nr:DUF2161 family putative PD-(D/E)XK-type phosphodiesterase [Paenibacillus pasadenensis]MCM3748116.1 DUF2161 family putative PD-(D/E)XK-type phosphodiesterase [Paenibacillus pasadenensis]
MAVREEAELYRPVKAYLEQQGYEVKGEVMNCDLVAMRPGESDLLIVELKKTFTLALLLQGVQRLRVADRVMLVVERNRSKKGAVNQRFGELSELCRMLGLGLMTVTFYKTKPPALELLCEPGDAPLRGRRPSRERRLLQEFRERSGDYNIGGSGRAQGRTLMTAYRERALRCAWALQAHGPLSPAGLRKLTGVANPGGLLRDNYYGWFAKVERGVYQLLPPGETALAEHAAVIDGWRLRQEQE